MGGRDPRSLTLDTGALIAVESADRWVGVILKRATERGAQIIVPAGALAQAWREGPREVRLALLLEDPAVAVAAIDAELARAAGELCCRRGADDVVDASVVVTGRRYHSTVLTSDRDDLRKLDPKLDLVVI
ncbi:MAG: PIN domain-containing protein [Chloroflexi bacterium]|nr:PIN domain-containing protein [Chloroflexota bacterium]